jgi:uncharacterized protein YndB with AHSA1/START domain
MRVVAQIEISAPPEAVWAYLVEPSRYLHFMAGLTRWEAEREGPMRRGGRYRMLMRVRSAEIGGLVEIVEFTPPSDVAWTSVMGIDQRGRWRLRERSEGRRTHVEFRLAYGVAGSGIPGWLAEKVAAPTVRGHLRRSLHQLKRQVEHEETRKAAARRRRARAIAAGGG